MKNKENRLKFLLIIVNASCYLQTGGPFDKYFRYPSQEEEFKDIIKSEQWQEDKVFVEQRVSGLNPMMLRKLGLKGNWYHLLFAHSFISYFEDPISSQQYTRIQADFVIVSQQYFILLRWIYIDLHDAYCFLPLLDKDASPILYF